MTTPTPTPWIGHQVGMSGVSIALAKGMLKATFSYGHGLDQSLLFTPEMQQALITYQTRINAGNPAVKLRTDGVLDFATQRSLGTIDAAGHPVFVERNGADAPGDPRPIIFSAQGAGVDMWTGYPADTARACLDLAYWQPTGNYPAAAFPMWQSVMQGVNEMAANIAKFMAHNPTRDIWLFGYSEGSLVVGMVWQTHFLPENGLLHKFIGNVKKVITWGFPARELGKANGNAFAGWPIPTGQGILAAHRMTNTPDFWYDFAHGGNCQWGRDLYTDTPNDEAGRDESAICDIIMQETLWSGPLALFKQVLALPGSPIKGGISAIRAVMDAGMFFGVKGLTPHTNYDITPAIAIARRP